MRTNADTSPNSLISQGDLLRGWKAIAGFFGTDERTVRRWESRGLPIRRVPGGERATIYAHPAELREWLFRQTADGNGEPAPARQPLPRQPLALGPAGGKNSRASRRAGLGLALALSALVVFAAVLPATRPATPRPSSPPPAARALVERADRDWALRTPDSLNRARAGFQQALRIAPSYAEAEMGLARTYLLMREFSQMPDADAYAAASDHIERAMRLDPARADAHAVAGFIAFWSRRDRALAEREFQRSIALDPRSAIAHQWHGNILSAQARGADALAELDRAMRIDPQSLAIRADRAQALAQDQPQAALSILREQESESPGFAAVHRYLADLCLRIGDDACFLGERRQLGDRFALFAPDLAEAGGAGLGGEHRLLLERLRANAEAGASSGRLPAFAAAIACARLRDRAAALRWLDLAVTNREAAVVSLPGQWEFAWLRQDSEFRRLLGQVYTG